jgi:iron complex outermembrane receptor protein
LDIEDANTQKAVFGDLSYEFNSQLKASAGLRWYTYNDDFRTTVSGVIGPTGTAAKSYSDSLSSKSGVNPKVNVSYALTNDQMFYATVAKGFRPGSGNLPIPVSGPGSCESALNAIGKTEAPATYAPDSVWSYELGEKVRIAGDVLTLNGAIYDLKWNNVQQIIPLSCGYFYYDNAGKAEVKGAELEVRWRIVKGLVLNESIGLSQARFTEAAPEAGVVNGQRLLGVPDWTFSTSLSYSKPMSDKLDITARVSNEYVGSRLDATYSYNYLRSYDLTGLRFGVTGKEWEVFVFANNLTNERGLIGNNVSFSANLPDLNRVSITRPRTIGIDSQFRF